MLFNFQRIQALKFKQAFPLRCFSKCNVEKLLNLKPFNSKLASLMRSGNVSEAQMLFDEMPQRSTVTYNSMIRGYFQNGFVDKAVNLYNRMPVRDIFSYNTMISGLMECGDVTGAEEILESMDCRDVVTWNSMISGYVYNGMIDKAVLVFGEMPVKDVVSWNLMLAGLVKVREFAKAEELYKKMSFQNVATWTIMMKGFLSAGQISEARECFDGMPERDVQAWNTMISGYLEHGFLAVGLGLFQKMPERDWNSWNEMITRLVNAGWMNDALKVFCDMPQKCLRSWNSILLRAVKKGYIKEAHAFADKNPLSDVVSWTNIMIGYFGRGEADNAMKVFEQILVRDTTIWNAAIFGLGENDRGEDGIKLFMRMKEDAMTLDEATFTSVLAICSNLPSLNLGKQSHAQVIKYGINSFTSVNNAVITMYFSCGNMDSALLEFYDMTNHDIISWNSVICGFARHGHAEKSIEIFEKMRLSSVKPNQITFVGVLSACSHAGHVEHGKYYFQVMKHEYSIQPTTDHYTCIVDLLARFGLMDEAISILDQMSIDGLEAPSSVWGALLGACKIHGNIVVGEVAGQKVLELEPSSSGVYVILAEMYLASGRKEAAERMWAHMKNEGVKKQPGCSWIESTISGQVFLSGDKTHPQFDRIACTLDLIYTEMGIENSKPHAVFASQAI